MSKLFGTDGVRGKANIELTPELAFRLGKAGAYVLSKGKEHAKIIIGKDTRISGDMLEAALAAGICAMGVDVLRTGVLPTPGIAYLTRTLKADAGVVISASHNPFEDNGIKFFAGSGYKLPDEMEDEIEAALNSIDDLESPSGSRIGTIMDIEDATDNYAGFLMKTSPSSLEGLTIVLDCANGAASKVGPKVLSDMGAKVIAIFNEPNGTNINVTCGSTHPEALAEAVLQYGADIGLACDGDADRIIAVDEKGQVLDGDFIMVICAQALKESNKLIQDSLVVTVMSNMGLHKACRKAGIKVLETSVGDRYVMEKLKETGAVLGGEQSGHIIFLEHNTTGDGLLSAMQLLAVLKNKKAPLSELAAQMQRFPQVLLNTLVGSKDKVMQSERLNTKILEVQRHLGEDGRILVRPSGTESLIRVMLEGPDQEELTRLAQEVVETVKLIDGKGYKV